MATNILDLIGHVQQQGELGQQQGRDRVIRNYASGAIGGDQGALAKIMGVDPNAGMQMQKYGQGQQDRTDQQRMERAQRMAQQLHAATDPAMKASMYRMFRPELVRDWGDEGMPQDYTPELDSVISQVAGGDSEATAQERAFAAMTRGMSPDDIAKARRVHLGLDPRAGYTPLQTADGYGVFNRQDATVAPLNYGGGRPRATMEPTGPASESGYTIDPALPPQVRDEIRAREGGNPRPWTDNTPNPYGNATPVHQGQRVMPVGKAPKFQSRKLSAEEIESVGLPAGTVAYTSESGKPEIINKPRDVPPGGGQVIDNGDGTTTFIPAGKVSEGERNAAGFYSRMVEANKELGELSGCGYDPTNLRDYVTVGGRVLNGLSSPEGQQYHQAAQNWVRANLRKESGAAIGVAEMDQEVKNYFPQFGDSKQVIAQKARNRQVVEQAMRTAAGGALARPKQATTPQPAASNRAPNITTKAQYDSLPSGAVFIEDGKQYRKP